MPVVFASSSVNQREQGYADLLDESYEFPRAYATRVAEGDVFVYYRGTKTADPAGYFGTGVVGSVRDAANPQRLQCRVLNVTFFDSPVPLRSPTNQKYFEDPGRNQINFQQGVRIISDARLLDILRVAVGRSKQTDSECGATERTDTRSHGGGYSNDIVKREATETFAVERVTELLQRESPTAHIEVQPRNNPGFDILVEGCDARFIEVKGTTGASVEFFLTEAERKFSQAHAEVYRLYVVYAIDLGTGAHTVFRHDGRINLDDFILAPRQYHVTTVVQPLCRT